MRSLVLLIFFIINLYSYDYVYQVVNGDRYYIYYFTNIDKVPAFSKDYTGKYGNKICDGHYCYVYHTYFSRFSTYKRDDHSKNIDCLVYVIKKLPRLNPDNFADYYVGDDEPLKYCDIASHKGYTWSSVIHAWYKSDTGEVLCQKNYHYDENQSKCIKNPECKGGTKYNPETNQNVQKVSILILKKKNVIQIVHLNQN